jgi:phosphonoacetaldehyde hydrolase
MKSTILIVNPDAAAAREKARLKLQKSTPHYLIDTIADLPEVITDIETRLLAGERP